MLLTRAQADWPAEVRKITQKRGVDLVVEHVGGEVLRAMFHLPGARRDAS